MASVVEYTGKSATVLPSVFQTGEARSFFKRSDWINIYLLVNCRFTLPFTVEKIRLAHGYTIRIWVIPVHSVTSILGERCLLLSYIHNATPSGPSTSAPYKKSFFLYLHPV